MPLLRQLFADFCSVASDGGDGCGINDSDRRGGGDATSDGGDGGSVEGGQDGQRVSGRLGQSGTRATLQKKRGKSWLSNSCSVVNLLTVTLQGKLTSISVIDITLLKNYQKRHFI